MPSLCQIVSKIINNSDKSNEFSPPPTELGYMHFPCRAHDGRSRMDKYRVAMKNLQDGDWMVFRSDAVPESLGGWGCMIRLSVRADVSLKEQLKDIKKAAREYLQYLLQNALIDEQTEGVARGEELPPLKRETTTRSVNYGDEKCNN